MLDQFVLLLYVKFHKNVYIQTIFFSFFSIHAMEKLNTVTKHRSLLDVLEKLWPSFQNV